MLMMRICSVESYDKEKETFLATSKETGLEVNAGMKRIKSSLKSENSCYHSVQNLVSSALPSKNTKIKIHRNVIFPFASFICENWSLTLREESRLRLFKNSVLRRIFGLKTG
jgi:hypothetical protein